MAGFLTNAGFLASASGTGDFTVSSGLVGYQTPSAAGAVDGIVYRYRASSSDNSQWEIGYGAYTVAGTTLARTTVIANSSGTTSKISFSAAPNVVITFTSEDINAVVVPTLAELAKLDTTKTTLAFVAQEGRSGFFAWKAGDYSSFVTNDPQSGVYKTSAAVASTSGAWQRVAVQGEYSIKWFGAVGDSTTDDTTAIQACIDFVESLAGGTVLFPKGGYVITAGLTVNTPLVRIKGMGCRYCSLISSSTLISMITVTAARVAIENLSIFNLVQSTGGALVFISTGATQFTISDLDLVGGYYCIEVAGGATNGIIHNVVARLSVGGAIAYFQNAGDIYVEGCVFDQDWPVSVPAQSNDKGARSNSHAYVVGDYVELGRYILQCAQAGTTGGSAPSLTGIWYGTIINDGTVKWYIAGVNGGSSVIIDSQSTYITLRNTDMTGAFYYGCTIQDSLVSGKPDVTIIDTCTTAGIVVHGFNILACKSTWLKDNEIQACIGATVGCSGIALTSGVNGEIQIKGNRVSSGFTYGVFLGHASGGSAIVEGNTLFGMTGAGVYAGAGVSDFLVVHNNLGSSTNFGANAAAVTVAVGGSDHYQISQNRINGASAGISDGGTGTNKTIAANY